MVLKNYEGVFSSYVFLEFLYSVNYDYLNSGIFVREQSRRVLRCQKGVVLLGGPGRNEREKPGSV